MKSKILHGVSLAIATMFISGNLYSQDLIEYGKDKSLAENLLVTHQREKATQSHQVTFGKTPLDQISFAATIPVDYFIKDAAGAADALIFLDEIYRAIIAVNAGSVLQALPVSPRQIATFTNQVDHSTVTWNVTAWQGHLRSDATIRDVESGSTTGSASVDVTYNADHSSILTATLKNINAVTRERELRASGVITVSDQDASPEYRVTGFTYSDFKDGDKVIVNTSYATAQSIRTIWDTYVTTGKSTVTGTAVTLQEAAESAGCSCRTIE